MPFISSQNFSVQNFSLDPSTRDLSFDFSGTMYQLDQDQPRNTKLIQGKVRINYLQNIECSFVPWSMEATINQTAFQEVIMVERGSDIKSEWWAFSDNGIKLGIITEKHLENMPLGTYTFTRKDLINRVTIGKYTGPLKATSLKEVLDDQWESYEYEGELVILEQTKLPKRKIRGTFRLKAYKNDQLIYEVINGTFRI